MQYFVAERILGGIAWACALPIVMLMTHFASSEDGVSSPLPFQPGLSSKDYLRLMAEAEESGLGINLQPTSHANNSFDPEVRLATSGSTDLVLATASSRTLTSNASTPADPFAAAAHPKNSVQPFVQGEHGASFAGASFAGTQSPNPRFSISYENAWLRRSGDEGTSWSSGGSLGALGEDRATLVRLGWYINPMERYEFAYLGSLVWHRSSVHAQLANGLLPLPDSEPDWFPSFQNSLQQEQAHTARLQSYEFNKRWITDDLGNYFIGLNIIDYGEDYELRTLDSDGSGLLGLSTSNLLAGLQGGLELWHPLSQRLALGGQGVLGLYGNFADGDWHVAVEDEALLRRGDKRFQTAAGFGLKAKGRYQFTSRLYAFGSYRWWYLAGMATVDDQTIGPLAPDARFALSTDAGFLIHGATCGLEFVF
jgi:hypothetical protein